MKETPDSLKTGSINPEVLPAFHTNGKSVVRGG